MAAPAPPEQAGAPGDPGPPIGQDGKPVRAIAFSSGAFDTAMQLGVVHALLAIQGKAPDAVVGVSAGAINAVALAEILQAGTALTPADWADPLRRRTMLEQRQRARIARFREIFETYSTAPGELGQAFSPDTLQVDASKPLGPVTLPIHDELERIGREREIVARQGLINLVNTLLSVRLSFGALTRFIRGGLGIAAAGELRSAATRMLARGFEVLRAWSSLGGRLWSTAFLTRPLFWPLVETRARPKGQGVTAAAIIYSRSWARWLGRLLRHLLSVVALYLVWVTVTLTAFALPFVLIRAVITLHVIVGAVSGWLGLPDLRGIVKALNGAELSAGAMLYGLLALAALAIAWRTGAWRKAADYNRTRPWAAARDLGRELWRMVPPLALLFVIPLLLAMLGFGLSHGHSFGEEFRKGVAIAVRYYWWVLLALVLVAAFVFAQRGGDSYARRILARYDLHDSLLGTQPLKNLFIRLFDPGYYGERRMDDIVDRALRDDLRPSRQTAGEKLLESYEQPPRSPPIAVGLMVANLAALKEAPTGGMRSRDIVEVVPGETKVVNGLLAATAVSPLFPPVPVATRHSRSKLFIDGANVAFEATRGLLFQLRRRVNPKSSAIQLYSVAALPFSQSNLPSQRTAEFPEGKPALTLMEVALRALLLQRFRDATLERRLTELFTRVIPPGKAVHEVDGHRFLRIWVSPVEPDQPLDLNQRLLRAGTPAEQRRLIAQTVADGCRAALEVMIRESLPSLPFQAIRCKSAVQRHLSRWKARDQLPLLSEALPAPRDAVHSPGLPEVCRHCKLSDAGLRALKPRPPGLPPPEDALPRSERALLIRDWEQLGPSWPPEYGEEPEVPKGKRDLHFERRRPAAEPEAAERATAALWPTPRSLPVVGEVAGSKRPLVSLLFSGGVFRGVYQVGTLNALSDVGLRPDIIAGASVGSITAAMVAQTFTGAAADGHASRMPAIARVAATYLAIDRLVLTDRFADFIRGLTLRAAATRFSLYQADRFLRRFDAAGANRFSREARMVAAGLERLFWLSPFELRVLVEAFRRGKTNKVYQLLGVHIQKWLDRMGVGNQVLGAEPLALLITEHVLKGIPRNGDAPVPFEHFLEHGIAFLATTVNLTEGCLEILGEGQVGGTARPAVLLEGLLASSAFPGVFRPRWSWEVLPGINTRHQYIDGGTMDNLPLDAVAHFLRRVSDQGRIPRRPVLRRFGPVPHLLFSASLEVNPDVPTQRELERYESEWPLVMRRAKQLRYNKKLDQFAESQRALRLIYDRLCRQGDRSGLEPLDLEVVMVRPRWLCGTFGFHPMLGFRRQRQAESIAHGCATALMELGRVRREQPTWTDAWGVAAHRLPANPPISDSAPILSQWAGESTAKLRAKAEREERPLREALGDCWYRPGVPCTFARQTLLGLQAGIPESTIDELAQIHRACGRPDTHRPRA